MAALFWAAAFLVLVYRPVYTISNELENDLLATITALDKLITYYNSNVKNLNLDGFFGLRVLEGQLQLLITEHSDGHHQHLPRHFINEITRFHRTVQNTTSIGVEFVKKDDFKYFNDFSSIIATPWMIMKPHRKLQPYLRWEIPQYKAKVKAKLTEELSDKCMTEMMQPSNKSCIISDECSRIMTTRGLTGYGITHQLLWSILGELMPNCSQSIDKVMKDQGMGNVSSMQLEMCTNNFYEMVAVVQVLMHGKVHESHQDLFLEQQFVCPNLGFYEFLKKDYLDQIISWQFPSGCFGDREDWAGEEDDIDITELLESYHESKAKLIPGVKNKAENLPVEKSELRRDSPGLAPELETGKDITVLRNPQENKIAVPTKIRVPRHVIMPKTSKFKLFNQTYQDSSYANIKYKAAVKSSAKTLRVSSSHNDNHKVTISTPQKQENQNFIPNSRIGDVQHVLRVFTPIVSKSKTAEVAPSKNLPTYNKDTAFRKQLLEHSSYNQNSRSSHIIERQQFFNRKIGNEQYPDGKRKFGRRLLVEKEMEGGCLSHKTGVAAGALVMYLRYLIDPGNIKWTGQHDLFLSDTRNLLQAGNGAQQQLEDAVESQIENEEDEEEEEEGDEEEEEYVPLDGLKDDEELDEDENEEDEEDGYNHDDEDYDDGRVNEKEDYNQENQNGNNVNRDNEDTKIRMVKQNNNLGGQADENQPLQPPVKAVVNVEDVADHEEDPRYYDDDGETDKGIIRKQKPITQRPHPPLRVRKKYSEGAVSQESLYAMGQGELTADHPNYFVILLVSVAPFFILFFFLFKFIRKRRVHIRYYR